MDSETRKASKDRYRERNREKINAKERERRLTDPERSRARSAKWRKNNLEAAREMCRKRAAVVRSERPDDIRSIKRGCESFRRARISGRLAPWMTNEEREQIKQFYANCPPQHEVDHIVPLRGHLVSGLHTISNLQYITKSENRRKGNRLVKHGDDLPF